MTDENEFLLCALQMGVFITLVYDILRIVRRVIPHKDFVVSMEDLGFWIYCAGEVFLMMYHESNGTLRWFAVLGAMIGMFFYHKLVSPWLVKYISLVLNKVIKMVSAVIHRCCKPFSFLCKKTGSGVAKAAKSICRPIKSLRRAVKNRLTYFFKMLKMTLKTK